MLQQLGLTRPAAAPDTPSQAARHLAEEIERARLERAKAKAVPAQEEPSTLASREATLGQLRLFEAALVEAGAELDRIKRDIGRRAVGAKREQAAGGRPRVAAPDVLNRSRVSDGAVLVATRLVRDGRSHDEVRRFLAENFDGIDPSSVVKLASRAESA